MSVLHNLIKKLLSEPPPPAPDEEKFNRLEFYKEIYFKELERRNSLLNEVAFQGTGRDWGLIYPESATSRYQQK